MDPTHRSSLFNLALMYHNELNDSVAAVPLLHRLIEVWFDSIVLNPRRFGFLDYMFYFFLNFAPQVYPEYFKPYMLLGDIELSVLKNATAAIKVG